MKYRVLSLFVFNAIFITNILAQHPDLQQGRWYLQQIVIEGETTEIPDDPINFPFTYLNFFSGTDLVASENTPNINFYGTDCQIGFTGHTNFISTNAFDFADFTPFSSTSECNADLSRFMSIYLDFFRENHTETFTYSITTNPDNTKTLRITNAVGDEVIYINTFLVYPSDELTDNTWFLQNMVIDGTSNFPPNNEEISSIWCNFDINQNFNLFRTYVCDALEGTQHFDTTQSNFYLYEVSIGLIQCGITENNDYHNMYFDFFLNSLPGPYNYTLEKSENLKTLTITNSSGDYAVYNSIITSVESPENSYLKVYPNPTSDIIYIDILNRDISDYKIEVVNMLGKVVYNSYNAKSVDLSSLQDGVYFLSVKSKDFTHKMKIIKR